METKYKETPIGKIPEEWKVVKFGEISTRIKTGPFGSQLKKNELTDSGIKVYTQDNILKNDFSIGNLYISNEKFNQLKSMEAMPNDVLLTIRGTVGKAAVFPNNAKRGIIHTNLAFIRLNQSEMLPDFLAKVINGSEIVSIQVKMFRSSTTLPALYAKTIKNLRIPLLSLSEQKKIAETLSTIDGAIQKVDEVIAKTERLKQSLMQELLTKGIGHKEFKDTEIGRIPKEWRITKLSDLAKEMKDGDWILKKHYTNKGVRLLQIGDIGIGKFLDSSNRFISQESTKKLECAFVEPEKDILISRMPDPIGRACLAPNLPYEYIVAVDITILKPKDNVDRKFIIQLLNSPETLHQMKKVAAGATRERISRKNLENIKVFLSPFQEQQKIAKILSTIDEKIELERQRKEKLEKTKRGLMHELLTGRKRVKVEA